MNIKEIKNKYDLTNADLAWAFGLSESGYNSSTAKKRYEQAVERIHGLIVGENILPNTIITGNRNVNPFGEIIVGQNEQLVCSVCGEEPNPNFYEEGDNICVDCYNDMTAN